MNKEEPETFAEANRKLNEAGRKLFLQLCYAFKIDKLCDWLERKLRCIKK